MTKIDPVNIFNILLRFGTFIKRFACLLEAKVFVYISLLFKIERNQICVMMGYILKKIAFKCKFKIVCTLSYNYVEMCYLIKTSDLAFKGTTDVNEVHK